MKKTTFNVQKFQRKEQGAILMISLFLLMILTIIGIATFQVNFTESKVQSNFSSIAQANFTNSVAMNAATQWVNSLTQNPNTCSSSPCCGGCVWAQGALQPSPGWPQASSITVGGTSTAAATWWQSNGITMNAIGNVPASQYVIEYAGCDETTMTRFFRIVTRSSGYGSVPTQIATQIVGSTKALPPAQQMYNVSNNMYTVGLSQVQNTVNVNFTGLITDLYIGEGCWSSSMPGTITLSSAHGGTYTFSGNLSPACCCVGTGATCNMGHISLPVPYKILHSDPLTITVVDNSNSCGFHTNSWNGVGAFRMTIMGVGSFCP